MAKRWFRDRRCFGARGGIWAKISQGLAEQKCNKLGHHKNATGTFQLEFKPVIIISSGQKIQLFTHTRLLFLSSYSLDLS